MYLDVYGHWRRVVLTRELFHGPGDAGRKDEAEERRSANPFSLFSRFRVWNKKGSSNLGFYVRPINDFTCFFYFL